MHTPSNRYRHPAPGVIGALCARLINSVRLARWRRAVLSRLPFMPLASDVSSVVYLTWLVPVACCAAYLPSGVQLWQRNGLTPLTVLTYRHRHFGPALGPLRRLFPSPLQSNWRLYLASAPTGAPPVRTVLFLKNIISSPLYTLATRLFSDVLPTHLPARFIHRTAGDHVETVIEAGCGSSPTLTANVRSADAGVLDSAFTELFGTWRDAVEFLACQDAAVAEVYPLRRLAFAEIELPIDLTQVVAATPSGPMDCSLLAELPPVAGPFCFIVPAVPFRAVSERLL